MERELAEALIEIIGDEDDAEINYGYSGRGMFGKETVAIVTQMDLAGVMERIIMCADLLVDEDGDPRFFNIDLRVDSMGLGVVIY
jgi:hypothetical protein